MGALYPVITCEGSNNEDWTGTIDMSSVVSRSLVDARVGIDLKNTSNPASDDPIISLWWDEGADEGAYLSITDAAEREIDFAVPKATMRELFAAGRYGGDLVIEWDDGDIVKVADVVWTVSDGYSDSDWVAA